MKIKKYLLLVLIITLKSTFLLGQSDSVKECNCIADKLIAFGSLEKMATFVGGEKELFKYVEQNLKYPEEAVNSKHEDKVIARFCVRENGKITDVKILRGKYEELNKEVLRLLSSMPNWEPAVSGGERICMEYIMPFNFRLKSEKK
ncbi:MAG: TonB family protein [Bacteroidetes bacterium]|nr:TonB family protein [Bacteroidota bacterium]